MISPYDDDEMEPPSNVRDLDALVSRICDRCRGDLLRKCNDDDDADARNFDFEGWQTPDPADLEALEQRYHAYRAEWRTEDLPGRGRVLVATFTMPYPKDAPMPGNTGGEIARHSILAFCAAGLKSAAKTTGNA